MLKPLAIALLSSLAAAVVDAQAPPPPYLMAGVNTVTISVEWDPATVDAVLPPGIVPVEGYTGGINLYTAPQGYGINPYSAAYAYVSVEGYDSSDGSKARYIMQGYYGPNPDVTDALVEYFAIAVTTGDSAQEATMSGGLSTWTGRGGQSTDEDANIKIEVEPLGGDCIPLSGTLNYVGYKETPKKGPKYPLLQIPYIGDFCPGNPIDLSLEGNGSGADPLDTLGVLSMTGGGQIKNASFAFVEG